MSTLSSNTETDRLLAQARALRTAYFGNLVARAVRPLGNALASVRRYAEARSRVRALSQLDYHTLVDVGLDQMVPHAGSRRPANENRPRYVA